MSTEPKLGLRPAQILAGALAAASAAVASSWLGVAGTVIGAAVMSVVASVASVLYARPIERSQERLLSAIPTRSSIESTVTAGESVPVSDPASTEVPLDPSGGTTPRRVRKVRWRTAALGAGAMMVSGLALLTGIELLAGEPASLTGGGRDRVPALVHMIRDLDGAGDDQPENEGGSEEEGDPTGAGSGGEREPADPGTSTPSGEPDPVEPVPTDPGSDEPSTGPTPTEPVPTEPTPAEPTPTEPSPSETAPTTEQPESSATGGTSVAP
jgi:hypothetical protein